MLTPLITKADVQDFFPEFAESESEEERIKKNIILLQTGGYVSPEDKKAALAWLAKQGEERTANKVEPKFHEGDFIVNKEGNAYKVVDVCNIIENKYHLRRLSDNGVILACVSVVDRQSRLWDITDAKEGDVLVTPNQNIFIFKKINGTIVYGYCGLYFNVFWKEPSTVNGIFDKELPKDYVPATIKQRNILFAKMKEEGYEWDSINKKPKKIEEFNGEDYGIDSLYHAQRILEKTLGSVKGYQTYNGMLAHQRAINAIKEVYEQSL